MQTYSVNYAPAKIPVTTAAAADVATAYTNDRHLSDNRQVVRRELRPFTTPKS